MITYDYYRIFYYVATCHSFTKAAQVLNNSQPNIMRYINNMEADLNCKLFVRGNHGVTLTPAGEKLFEHAKAAFEHLTLGEEELRRNLELESGLITIGVSEIALRIVLLTALEHFHEKYPGIHTHISNHSTPQAIEALQHGIVDFSVVTTPLNIKKPLHTIPLISFREILLGGPKYQKISDGIHSLTDLNEFPFISLQSGTGTRELYTQYFLNVGLSFHPEMETATADQILPMIEHNLGIGFYPEVLARESVTEKRIYPIRLLEPVPEREVCLIVDDSKPLSKAAETLITELGKIYLDSNDSTLVFPETLNKN